MPERLSAAQAQGWLASAQPQARSGRRLIIAYESILPH